MSSRQDTHHEIEGLRDPPDVAHAPTTSGFTYHNRGSDNTLNHVMRAVFRWSTLPHHDRQSQKHIEFTMPVTKTIVEEVAPCPERVGSRTIVGDSAPWRHVLKQAAQVAWTETTTCLLGESGTGKEIVARLIHQSSRRHRGPFVAINCAALPDELLESELFGYERGAFTGAVHPKPGQLELAFGGVLFLDEIAEMTLAAQAKLLRVLQEREFMRLGGTRRVRANLRVICASNRDLHDAVATGRFRQDLFYRVHVFDIRLPSLRERRDDIAPLARHFLLELSAGDGSVVPELAPDALEALRGYDWPGNVRELRNVIERAAILCEGGLITPRDLSLHAAAAATRGAAEPRTLDVIERRTIEHALREVGGNKSHAARRLGISRTQLYIRLRRYRLQGHIGEAGRM